MSAGQHKLVDASAATARPEQVKGRITNLQRFSIHDGPGIRTTVFFKGCPLSCLWCHNPENISPAPEIVTLETRCIGCGACAEICPTCAIKMEDQGNKRILHTWHTTVELHTCPQCGRFFVPEPMSFLKEMFPEIEDLWALCPECRQQRAARQWIEQRATSPV